MAVWDCNIGKKYSIESSCAFIFFLFPSSSHSSSSLCAIRLSVIYCLIFRLSVMCILWIYQYFGCILGVLNICVMGSMNDGLEWRTGIERGRKMFEVRKMIKSSRGEG